MKQFIIIFPSAFLLCVVVLLFLHDGYEKSLFAGLIEDLGTADWSEISERNIVKNSIRIKMISENNDDDDDKYKTCTYDGSKISPVINHEYFTESHKFTDEIQYNTKDNTILALPCYGQDDNNDLFLNIWYVLEESKKHPGEYRYFVTNADGYEPMDGESVTLSE